MISSTCKCFSDHGHPENGSEAPGFTTIILSILIRINFKKNTQKRLYEGGNGQYDGQGEYCGLSVTSEVFLIFTSQIYS